MNEKFEVLELDKVEKGPEIQSSLAEKTGRKTVPQVFVNGSFIGGCDDTLAANESGSLREMLKTHGYDYDLIVIGGGSGGLAASKQASMLGKKVALFDFVVPSPIGTSWGLGGTCVNVGCIPKKLMHQAALLGEAVHDSESFGWETKPVDGQPKPLSEVAQHNWSKMVQNIQNHIKGLNFGYRVSLRDEKVQYINAYVKFESDHVIVAKDKKGVETKYSSDKFLIATGERPRYSKDVEGYEFGITSDDIFSLPYNPGKTLFVGASYIALECAGFLKGMGNDVTVMVRSILLRGFDQEMAEKIGAYMEKECNIKFHRKTLPVSIEKLEDGTETTPGRYRVTFVKQVGDTKETSSEEFNTIVWAIGRDPCTDKIGLDKAGVAVNPKTGKIPVINEQTNVPHIYAVGDILQDRLELTPVAIEAGKLLSLRLFSNATRQCEYINVPTTVFTPLEYGSVGYSEEKAVQVFEEENVEVYHKGFVPLEWSLPHRSTESCWAKLIVLKNENERVVGFHFLGPNAGEVTQMAALALKFKATKTDFDSLIGIHPTNAEVFTTMFVTKSSGGDAKQKGC